MAELGGPSAYRDACWARKGLGLLVTDPLRGEGLFLGGGQPPQRVRLGPHPGICAVALSPDGRWAATAGRPDGDTFVWETAGGKRVAWIAARGWKKLLFSPDGRWLVTAAGEERAVRFWRVGTWEPGLVIQKEGQQTVALAFRPGGGELAVAEFLRGIRLLDPATGEDLALLEAPEDNSATGLCFSADGGQLAVATDNHTVQLWDLRSVRTQLRELGLNWDAPPESPRADGPRPRSVEVVGFPAPPLPWRVPEALEAEDLEILHWADCTPVVQPLPGQWSNGRHLFCRARKGGYVELALEVTRAGEYALNVYFTRARDYGRVQVSVDGQPVGGVFEGYHASLIPSGKVAFGTLHLSETRHRLQFRVVDRHPQSQDYYLGIDCLVLTPMKRE
jgi:hypothetical protein